MRRRYGRSTWRQSWLMLAAPLLAAVLIACGASDAPVESGPGPVPDPCRGVEAVECRQIAAADLTGTDDLAGVGLLEADGEVYLRVATGDGSPVRQAVIPDADPATESVGFYDLDGRPGAEIVVDAGRRGAYARFGVFGLDDGRLQAEVPMAEVRDEATGLWAFPGTGDRRRVVCRAESVLSLSTELGDGQVAVRDYRYDTSVAPDSGESRFRPDGPVEVMSAGQVGGEAGSDFFGCADLRAADLPITGARDPAARVPTGCDPDRDMSEAMGEAVASLPTDRYRGWDADQATLDPDPCRTLSAAVIPLVGTLSAPTAILLFHEGDYVGPASECFAPMVTITQPAEDTVLATYRYPREGEPNVAASGQAEVEFRWQDGEVATSGSFPAELRQLVDCDV